MPSKTQANFWVDNLKVKNINVKDYEASDLGNSGVSGKFGLSGTLYVQPKGYVWSMEIPFRVVMRVDEHPQSGTIVFNALNKRGIDQMVETAISDYSWENKIVKMLGRLDFVHYGDRRASLAKSVVARHIVVAGLTDKLYGSLRDKHRKFEMGIHKTLRAYMNAFEKALLKQDFVLDHRMSDISYWMDSEGIYPEGELYFVDKRDHQQRDSIQVAKDLEKVGIEGSVWWQGNHWRVKFGGK